MKCFCFNNDLLMFYSSQIPFISSNLKCLALSYPDNSSYMFLKYKSCSQLTTNDVPITLMLYWPIVLLLKTWIPNEKDMLSLKFLLTISAKHVAYVERIALYFVVLLSVYLYKGLYLLYRHCLLNSHLQIANNFQST